MRRRDAPVPLSGVLAGVLRGFGFSQEELDRMYAAVEPAPPTACEALECGMKARVTVNGRRYCVEHAKAAALGG